MKPCLASVFIATSLDGYIARLDGELDWLPSAEADNDMGYETFSASVDVLVMGRHTFEKVLSFGDWPYDLPVKVLSHSKRTMPQALEAKAEFMQGEPAAILGVLASQGFRHAYIDGGETIQAFIRAQLIERLIITRVPVLIGEGLSLFGKLSEPNAMITWRHVKTFTWSNGLVQSHYYRT